MAKGDNVVGFPMPDPVFETGRENLPEDLKEKYDLVLSYLTMDARGKAGFGFIEQMMSERVALLHCIGLDRARMGIGTPNPADPDATEPGFKDFGEYTDFWKMWFDLASKLQRAHAQTVASHNAVQEERNQANRLYTDLIKSVIESDEVDIPEATREFLRKKAKDGTDFVYKQGRLPE